MNPVLIIKADGTQENFDRDKLIGSLEKAGASEEVTERIVTEVEASLKPGMKTGDIYRNAFTLLRKEVPHSTGTAARYSLRRALLDFGPSGFPFEAYLAELFRRDGFEATTNLIVRGKCVPHEIDVLLKRDNVNTYVEAKFHNASGIKTDLKVALYVKARIDDLRALDKTARGMIVTNTKFTTMAIDYATCSDIEILGWDYPKGNDLQDRIDREGLYPVTALSSLTKREKDTLLAGKIVLCKSVPQNEDFLRNMGMKETKLQHIFEEVGAVCK